MPVHRERSRPQNGDRSHQSTTALESGIQGCGHMHDTHQITKRLPPSLAELARGARRGRRAGNLKTLDEMGNEKSGLISNT